MQYSTSYNSRPTNPAGPLDTRNTNQGWLPLREPPLISAARATAGIGSKEYKISLKLSRQGLWRSLPCSSNTLKDWTVQQRDSAYAK